ncbi:MAG TPA: fasciclin domain-containing protein [Phnomibacter sp.]|nr:fasciclin domain-containing protein [Phnomibacter sp.]
MKSIIKPHSLLAAISMAVLALVACKKEKFRIATTDDVNMVGYLAKYPDSFSLWKQILDRTENSAFLNAYGAYTMFAPTNSGVTRYLSAIGAGSVAAADINVLKDIVRFHLLEDTISTGSFTDGKLPVPTMLGQYLITGVNNAGAVSRYFINRQALVYQSNIRVGNGIIHEISEVLRPATKTLAATLEENANYSIFVQAMKETGFYNRLNVVNPNPANRWYTVLAESNAVLAAAGFPSYAALKAKYSQTGNPANTNDSLHMYVAYHILGGLKYLGDIITASSHQTLQPEEVVSSKLVNQKVLINDDVFNDVYEPGVELVRDRSDNSTTNGVFHSTSGHFMVKYRAPQAVYWDVSSFDEIKKLPAFYRRQNYNFVKANELDRPIKDINWHYNSASTTLTYAYSTSAGTSNRACFNDINILPIGPPARAAWAEYITPVIVKGRYKVWICYRTQRQSSSSVCVCNIRINGELMQRPMAFTDFIPAGTDAEREAIGWKRYTEVVDNNYAARLVGTIDIKTTERHTLRFEAVTGTQNTNNLDMIHFIPIDENQVLPRFAVDGTKIYQ